MRQLKVKQTTDVWLAAFLMKKGHKVAKYDIIGRGKVACFFDVQDEEWNKLKLEFNNSDISEYKALIGKIRDLGYQIQSRLFLLEEKLDESDSSSAF